MAGGVGGYLQDQGVDQQVAGDAEAALRNGRAVIIVKCPSGKLEEPEIAAILVKYGATTFGRISSPVVPA